MTTMSQFESYNRGQTAPAQTINNTSSFKTSFIANVAEVVCNVLGCYIVMLANSRQKGRKLSTLCPDGETVGCLQNSWHLPTDLILTKA